MDAVSSVYVAFGIIVVGLMSLAYGFTYLMHYAIGMNEYTEPKQEPQPITPKRTRSRKNKDTETPRAKPAPEVSEASKPESLNRSSVPEPQARQPSFREQHKAVQTWTGVLTQTSRHDRKDEKDGGKYAQFFAVIRNGQGDVEVSGNGLGTAIDVARVRIGDQVLIQHVGMEDVVVYTGGKPLARKRKKFVVSKI